jgi:proteic killer suppression protein
MLVRFKSQYLKALYEVNPREIKGKHKIPGAVIQQYQNKIKILLHVSSLEELRQFKSLNFERLKGDRAGELSIRLNKQYRLIFTEVNKKQVEVEIIEISKHYEN